MKRRKKITIISLAALFTVTAGVLCISVLTSNKGTVSDPTSVTDTSSGQDQTSDSIELSASSMPTSMPDASGATKSSDTQSTTTSSTTDPAESGTAPSESTTVSPTQSSSSGTSSTTTKTNTPTPSPKPAAKADPYDDCCDCPDCGRSGSVSYHSARKVHHDAVTHEEKTVTYDKVIRTYKYIANWTDSFKNWCSEHGYSIPEAPSTTGTVVFDYDFQNVLDSSGDKTAKGQVLSEANSVAESMGYEEIPCSYYTEVIDDEYVNLQEITTTVVDQAAWDETIPAGWYCDNCDYYSSSVPSKYIN